MKSRAGFVSNSSSSSFICGVCGDIVSGWDVDFEDYELISCERGHTFCEGHLDNPNPNNMDTVHKLDFFKIWATDSVLDNMEDEEKAILSKTAEEIEADSDLKELLEECIEGICEEWRHEYPTQFCPVCTLQAVRDCDILTFVLKGIGKTKEQVTEAIREKYNSLEELLNDQKK